MQQASHRNRAARPHIHCLLLEDFLHRLRSGGDISVLRRDHGCRCHTDHADIGHDAFRRQPLYLSRVLTQDFVRVHLRHQPHADLGCGHSGDHGLRAFAREAAANAVNFERRARPEPLEHAGALFTHQCRGAHLFFQEILFLEGQPFPGCELLRAGFRDPLIKTGNPDLAIRTFKAADDFCERL